VLRAVITPIQRTGWRSTAPAATRGHRPHRRDLGLPIVGDRKDIPAQLRTAGTGSAGEHVARALCLPFGHSYFEQVYRSTTGAWYHLRKLGYRPPRTISKFNVARDGGLVSIEQKGTLGWPGAPGNVVLPVNRLVAYVLDREGRQLARPLAAAAGVQELAAQGPALRDLVQTVDRNGHGHPDVHRRRGEPTSTPARRSPPASAPATTPAPRSPTAPSSS
jgi:hypothetical protein